MPLQPLTAAHAYSILLDCEDFVCVCNAQGGLEFLNPAGCRLMGVNGAALPELTLEQFMPAAACTRIRQLAAPDAPDALSPPAPAEELFFIDAAGDEHPLCVRVVRLGSGNPGSFAIVARDCEPSKKMADDLLRLARAQRMLGSCNRLIREADDETRLSAALCRLLTEEGGHRFALVCLLPSGSFDSVDAAGSGRKMLPTAWSGGGADGGADGGVGGGEFLAAWRSGDAQDPEPAGTALRSGQPAICHDLELAPQSALWRGINARLGLRSAMALPLVHAHDAEIPGVLSIHSSRAGVFDAGESALLLEIARQLAHRVHALRSEAAGREAAAALCLFSGALASTPEGVMLTDAQGSDHPIVYVNPAFTRMTGWRIDEVLGRSGRILAAGDLQQPEMEAIRHALRGRTAGQAVLRCFRKDGQPFWGELHVAPIRNAAQAITHYVSVIADVSERILHEDRLAHLATHDPLTGLANRTLFGDRLQQAIARAQRDQRLVAVLLINLDRFRQINETLGHGAGDLLLHRVASRLKCLALESDTLARLGGDEFVLLLTDLENELDVPRTGQLLLEQLASPFALDGEEISVSPSIGAAIYPLDATDAGDLLRLADVAMRAARESGRNAFRHFSPEMNRRSQQQLVLEKDLRRALERNELLLHYQPKADLYSGNLTGAEALIRWQHPQRGLIPPTQFIPLAEESGLIVAIGGWVLREACRQAAQWQQDGLPPLRVAVNLSPLQFRQPDLVEQVEKVLAQTGLNPCWLELEVTESLVMDNPEAAADFLGRLKKMGIRLAMDDFGTGYSSLGYLKRFPFDVLKIDRSFVQNIVSEPDDALIAVAVIAMAHSLGLKVVAEGVEDESQMCYLRSHLCDEMQGFLYSRPLPADELAAFVRDPRPLALPAESGDRQERTLLLVDDEPDILNSLKRLLRRSGYRILTAASAAEGLELLALNRVQVVVSDQRMPVMNGSEFLSRVRQLYPDTLRIVLSGYTELAALTDAINRGAIYKFITKPWNEEILREVIHEAFVTHGHRAGQKAAEKSRGEEK